MENDSKAFLGSEPVGKLLFRLAVPTILAQLVNMLYNVVDRIYIGHIEGVGNLALTGVGICMPLIMAVSAFAALIAAGGAPRASIFLGKGDKEQAEKVLSNCFSMLVILSAMLTVILLLWSKDFLLLFGGSSNTIGYAANYMGIYAAGTLFVQVTLGMNAFITAQGFTKISMMSVLIGAVCNIVLDPLFIFGFNMGVRGAALATIVSQAVSCIWVMRFLLGKKTTLRIRRRYLPVQGKIILPCLALGLAPFIMQSSESLISMCFNSSLQTYGGDIAVGAMTILTSVMQFAMLPLQGVAQGAQPITSYNFGAGNRSRVLQSFRVLLAVSLTYSAVLWAAIMLFPGVFASIFTPDPTLLDFSSKVLPVYCGALLIFGVQIACQMTFVAIGSARASIIVAVVRKFVLLLPLIYLMPCVVPDKTLGVYMAEPVADAVAVTFTAILFSFQFRKALRSMKEPEPPCAA